MRILLLLSVLTLYLYSSNINESLIKVHATLIPKLYLMDFKSEEKVKEDTIIIGIVFNENNYKNATNLKRSIDLRYKKGIKNYKIKSELIEMNNISNSYANIYYIFPTRKQNILRIIDQASKNKSLTFSYNKDDLKNGVMISLNISKKIKPIINLAAIKKYNIEIRSVLIDISDKYEETKNEF